MLLKDEMRLKRENFIVMWAHWKIHFIGNGGGGGGRVSQKKQCIGGIALKVGLGQFADLREGGVAKESNALYVDY